MTKQTNSFWAFLFLMNAFIAFGQSKQELEVKDSFWGANDSQKGIVDIPEKWKKESAVILYQEYFYDYHKYAKNVRYTSSTRKRIKVMDKAAIEDYSEFSFEKKFKVKRGRRSKEGKKYMGIKIIKPNGDEKEIAIDEEAVLADDEYKLAISGLEAGDILDYYVYTIEPFKQKYGYSFDPITAILNDDYPTKEFVLRFNTENDFFINFNSYNGAPKLQEIETGERNDRRYVLKAQDIEKSDFPVWYYPLIELPYYKFQVTFARSGSYEKDVFNFLSDEEKNVKTVVSADEIFEQYGEKTDFRSKATASQLLIGHFKDSELSDEELVKQAFYYLRHYNNTQLIELGVMMEAKLINSLSAGVGHYINYRFMKNTVYTLGRFLVKRKIPFDIVLAVPRNEGNIKDILFSDGIERYLRVNLPSGPMYFKDLAPNILPNELDYIIEGTEAYAIPYSYKEKAFEGISTFKMPTSTYKDNNTTEKTTVSIDGDFSGYDIQKTSSFIGNAKLPALKDILYFPDYLNEDLEKFDNRGYIEKAVKKKKNKARLTKEYDALIEKVKKNQSEFIEKNTESEYGFEVEDHGFQIISSGRYDIEAPFVFSEEFKIKENLIKKAGKNYLLEIGKLIGGQVSIDEKDKTRSNNIYMNYPRSFTNTIELNIPEGYTVSGLDKLNKRVENETGGFVSSTVVQGNILKIETHKYYKNYYEENANWGKMVDFLDAAYQFTQEKVLLKKK